MHKLKYNCRRNPLIVVVTVCRNDLSGLKTVVESVRSNRYPRLWHIVIDGNSSDGTASYLSKNKSLFAHAISEPDEGIYDAMNKAIDQCPEDAWVIFLNAGDRFESDNILIQLADYLNGENDFIFGGVSIRESAGNVIYNVRRNSLIGMPSCHQSTLTRSTILKRFKFDTSYKVGADFDFFLRASSGRRRRMAYIEHVIAEIAPEGYSARNEMILQQDYFRTISRHLGKALAYKWLLRRIAGNSVRGLVEMAKRK